MQDTLTLKRAILGDSHARPYPKPKWSRSAPALRSVGRDEYRLVFLSQVRWLWGSVYEPSSRDR